MGFGAFAAATQFYLYGKRHFTASGWVRHSAKYDVSALERLDLRGKVYVVTGANSGIGLSLSEYLAGRGATLYLVCRNRARGDAARDAIVATSKNERVHTLVGDCGIAADVRRLVSDLSEREKQIDALVCNAGAMANKRVLTADGYETTFATHLLHGSYLLSTLSLPLLSKSRDPRVVFVSSGGALTTPFPSWELAARGEGGKFSGQAAYTYAKRGQILLAERLDARHAADGVRFVSAHPGWVDTPGLDGAYGSKKSLFQPLRSGWQGVEGIAWLCACDGAELDGGAFYLDRRPGPKHLAGAFFGEGSFTKNTDAEVDAFMDALEAAVGDTDRSASPSKL